MSWKDTESWVPGQTTPDKPMRKDNKAYSRALRLLGKGLAAGHWVSQEMPQKTIE